MPLYLIAFTYVWFCSMSFKNLGLSAFFVLVLFLNVHFCPCTFKMFRMVFLFFSFFILVHVISKGSIWWPLDRLWRTYEYFMYLSQFVIVQVFRTTCNMLMWQNAIILDGCMTIHRSTSALNFMLIRKSWQNIYMFQVVRQVAAILNILKWYW